MPSRICVDLSDLILELVCLVPYYSRKLQTWLRTVCVGHSLLPIDLEWPKGQHHLTEIEKKIMVSVKKWINSHRTSLARRQKYVKLTEILMILLPLVTVMRISEAYCKVNIFFSCNRITQNKGTFTYCL